jgi:hypothetical protein
VLPQLDWAPSRATNCMVTGYRFGLILRVTISPAQRIPFPLIVCMSREQERRLRGAQYKQQRSPPARSIGSLRLTGRSMAKIRRTRCQRVRSASVSWGDRAIFTALTIGVRRQHKELSCRWKSCETAEETPGAPRWNFLEWAKKRHKALRHWS